MAWELIEKVRAEQLRGSQAELAREWHLAVHHYLFCFQQADAARDRQARRYFAAKLCRAYEAMGMPEKACRYRALAD